MNIKELRTALKLAKDKLAAAGWDHVCSVMHDGSCGDYGSCFIKTNPATRERKTFWLNMETVSKLPAGV